MKLIDEIYIIVKPGNGGDGCCNYYKYRRRNIYDGGDGGNGGSIILIQSEYYFFNHIINFSRFYAEDGQKGTKNIKTGKNGLNTIVKLCKYTQVFFLNKSDEYNNCLINDTNTQITIQGGNKGIGSKTYKYTKEQQKYFGEVKEPIKLKCIASAIAKINIIIDCTYSNTQKVLQTLYNKSIRHDDVMIYKCGNYDVIVFTFLQKKVLKHTHNAKTNIYIYDLSHTKEHNIKNIFSMHINDIQHIHHYLHTFLSM